MFSSYQFQGVVDRALTVIVVTDSAVEKMITKNSIKCLPLRITGGSRIRPDCHSGGNADTTCPDKSPFNFDQTRIAGLDWTKLRVIAHLWDLARTAVDDIDEAFTILCLLDQTINRDTEHPRFPLHYLSTPRLESLVALGGSKCLATLAQLITMLRVRTH
jgi:hypothetical protein